MHMRVNPQRQFLSHKCLPMGDYARPNSPQNIKDSSCVEIGDYKMHLTDFIGRGSFSKVYSAKNTVTKQRVAIKVVAVKDLKDALSKDLLRSEMSTIKEMRHPHVLCCLDIFVTQSATYIITEHCEGDLAKLIKTNGILQKSQAMTLFDQIIKGYTHIRQSGYIHRDLKPANILLKNSNVKIADFGFAKLVSRDSSVKERFNLGSPLYMPPESLRDNTYSEKSDIWSLGVVFYQMLTGKPPFRAHDQRGLLQEMLSMNMLSLIRENTPLEFHSVLQGCLKVDISKRFSLDELIRTIGVDTTDLDFSNSPVADQLQQYYRKIDKVLINELNYIEFLRKLDVMLASQTDPLSMKVKFIVGKNMRCRLDKLSRVQNRVNVYNMPKWQDFVRKANFNTYLGVISKLALTKNDPIDIPIVPADKRFSSLIVTKNEQNEKLLLTYQHYLRQLLRHLYEVLLQSRQLMHGKYEDLLLMVDFFMSAYQLNALHIEHYAQPIKFAELSCLGIIVNGKSLVDDSVFDLLQKKYGALDLL